ncbi:MAG TPA: prepilin-type N-terminal cleavage/methylation domain-containing protein [Symbiobacteriaceae bacterium]|nr:prepilin-type N-terminal cleavage/methylation domain-containing protein [Symbiobacteriaceae bacterium]
MRRNRVGLTLIELLITVAVIGVLASGSTLAFGRMLKSGRLNQGADIIKGALREAQVQAFQDGNLWRVSVATGDSLLYLEKATDPVGADRGCGSTGWGGSPARRYELPQGVTVGLRSGECVVFGQAGRVVSRAPYADFPPGTYDPYTLAARPRLVDGKHLSPADLAASDPTAAESGAVALATGDMPDIIVDLREPRYFSSICVGLISSLEKHEVGYPDHLTVVASTSANPTATDWTILLFDGAGPPDPTDGSPEPRCVDVTVDREIRFLRVTISGARPGTDYWAFDEIDLGSRFFTIQYGSDSQIVEVNPTTGRVCSKNC